jgi:UDPglucose 6-dehydrogenase
LAHMAAEAGLHPQLLEAVMAINTDQRRLVLAKLQEALGDDLAGRRIGVLGLAFKDNTDDMRDAPALDIVRWLVAAGAEVRAYDPVAEATARAALEQQEGEEPAVRITYCPAAEEAAAGADAVVVVTEWAAFRELDLARLRAAMAPEPGVLVDGRNLYDPAEMRRLGFRYQGIGRPAARGPHGPRAQKANGANGANGTNGHGQNGRTAASAVRQDGRGRRQQRS